MKYVQGFDHFDECPRTKNTYAPCSCDVLKLQKKTLSQAQVPIEFQQALAAQAPVAEAPVADPEPSPAVEEAPVAEAPVAEF